jgi:hypothetical protein
MSTQLLDDAADHAHRHRLTAQLGLLHDFGGDRFNRMSRTHNG